MPNIRILDDRLVSQIAAGEVVERPASVVKELIENSLDAAARSIQIELETGGKRGIRVVDDGVGMGSEDALLAFDRHATSKIAAIDDLQQIGTLGFRGEALSSIASVARVELDTATEPGRGHRVKIEGGRVKIVEPAARSRGTTVAVRSLFFNVPARRKFLKSPRTELRRSTEVVQGYALARPDVGFQLLHDGKTVLDAVPVLEGSAGARQRISELFGPSLGKHLHEIRSEDHWPEQIWGFVGDLSTTKGRRYFTYVNRRLLRDRALMATFYRAVREEWRRDEFPALFLFLDLSPDEVDVNVHPQKSEVRFRDPGLADRTAAALQRALREALAETDAPLRLPNTATDVPFIWQGIGEHGRDEGVGGVEEPSARYLANVVYPPLEPRSVPLSGKSASLRRFRLLGQYKGSLILLEGPQGLYLIDQHAAHERILYERLRLAFAAEDVVSQAFVEPLVLELAPAERVRLAELESDLDAAGFSLTELSSRTWALRSAAAGLSPAEAEELILSFVTEPQAAEDRSLAVRDRLLHVMAANLSCKSAIKIHHPLSIEKMEKLVEELFAAEQPFACPHGRPTVLEMTDADLERRFGRR